MEKLSFTSDYQEGAHPSIIARLQETNLQKHPGYGTDEICAVAREKIRAACAAPGAGVWFLVGGTQTNATVIGALLRSYQGVVAAETGHVAGHEAGAIELGGHKVLTLPQRDGKLDAGTLRAYCESWRQDEAREHLVMPGMVYISQPTEYGTLYSLAELEALRAVCAEYRLPLYADGARLAYALACPENDVTLPDMARLCDVFSIGGTKCGALFGEAVVARDPALLPDFFTVMKQHGAVLAKGWLLGIQFDALFSGRLYGRIGAPAIRAANALRAAALRLKLPLAAPSPTNQVFLLLPNGAAARLAEQVEFTLWERPDEAHAVVRFAFSWATEEADVSRLLALLKE